MTKLPIQADVVRAVIMNPQDHRRISNERNFVIVARDTNNHNRNVELHLTEDELTRLVGDGAIFLSRRPERTTVTNYDES